MTISLDSTAPCYHCSAPRLAGLGCNNCGAPARQHAPHPVVIVAAPKTPGLAVLLSFLWFGAGHLYANRTATGVVLVIIDCLLLCLAVTGVGLVIALPVWVVMAPIVMALSASAAADYNRRNGLVLR